MARLALFERATGFALGPAVPVLVGKGGHAVARQLVRPDPAREVSAAAEFWRAADAVGDRRKYLLEAAQRLGRRQVLAAETAAGMDPVPAAVLPMDLDGRAAPEAATTVRPGTVPGLGLALREERSSARAVFGCRGFCQQSAILVLAVPMARGMAALGTAEMETVAKEMVVKARAEERSRGQDRCRVEAAVLRLPAAVIVAPVAASARVRAPARGRLPAASRSVREQLRKRGFRAKGQQGPEVRAAAYPS